MDRTAIIAGLLELHAQAEDDLVDADRRVRQYAAAILALEVNDDELDTDTEPVLAAPTEVTGRTLTDITLHAVTLTTGTPDDGVHPIDRVVPVTDAIAEARRDAAKAEHPSAPRPRGGTPGTVDYDEVASIARRAYRAGASPAEAVGRHYDITTRAAQQRIDKARKLGHPIDSRRRPSPAPAFDQGPTDTFPELEAGLGPIDRTPFDPDATRLAAAPPPQGPIAPLAKRDAPTDGRPANPQVGDVFTPARALAILDAANTPDDAA